MSIDRNVEFLNEFFARISYVKNFVTSGLGGLEFFSRLESIFSLLSFEKLCITLLR